ncbi:MAG: hypothetical protein JNK29_00310 [Anaerolineales bacterium]|nr:hypothetical protein [Anaerolineales bacterium]
MTHPAITCPWCGTHYASFQSNCRNCGGPLPAPEAAGPTPAGRPAEPPPAPRPIPDSYARRLMLADGWSVAAGVFTLLGAIFTGLGGALTVALITAFVGLPFLGMGLVFLGLGGAGLAWRYRLARRTVEVLRHGTAVLGEITQVEANYSVRVNGQHPWLIGFHFPVVGRTFTGQVVTLNPPGPQLQPGQPAWVLYLPAAPEHNALFPHP